jgi:titin
MKLSFVEEKSSQCPKFTDSLKDINDLKDGDSVHLQCSLEPVNDADLKVEWFFNGKPLPHSSRLKTVADFGYVMLDIAGIDSRDSGEYSCRAWNK